MPVSWLRPSKLLDLEGVVSLFEQRGRNLDPFLCLGLRFLSLLQVITLLRMEEVPGTVTYVTCRWMDSGRMCKQQFHEGQAYQFMNHLALHVEAVVIASKRRFKSVSTQSGPSNELIQSRYCLTAGCLCSSHVTH
jgi:hypothetical protein